jgi:hypothetical protein
MSFVWFQVAMSFRPYVLRPPMPFVKQSVLPNNASLPAPDPSLEVHLPPLPPSAYRHPRVPHPNPTHRRLLEQPSSRHPDSYDNRSTNIALAFDKSNKPKGF